MKPTTLFEGEIRKIVKKELQPLGDEYCILLDPTLLTENLLSLIQTTIRECMPEKDNPTFKTDLAKHLPWNESRAKYFIEGNNQAIDTITKKLKENGLL